MTIKKRKKYSSWKGYGIQKAERIELDLEIHLKRKPTQKDFKAFGCYNVWMALYEYRRKKQHHNKFFVGDLKNHIFNIRQEILFNPETSKDIIKGFFKDCIIAMGIDEAEDTFLKEKKELKKLRV